MERLRLVIVEDDPMVMEVHSTFVNRIGGYTIVGKAFSGKETFEVIKKTKPDLVLLDYFLPDMDGLSIVKEIRRQNCLADVILVTANRSPDHIQQILRFGAVDYICKPFRFERLRTALEQYRCMSKKASSQQASRAKRLDSIAGMGARDGKADPGLLPKGLSVHTLEQILEFLAGQTEPLSAEEVAAGTGLARVTVRRYLEYLQNKGRIRREIQYGSVGRPVNRYKL